VNERPPTPSRGAQQRSAVDQDARSSDGFALEAFSGAADQFLALTGWLAGEKDDVLVLSCDGKGVVMRPEALRAQAQKQAQSSSAKLSTRLSDGEKRGRKRMAEVCAAYEVTPAERSAADILPADEHERQAAQPAPKAKNKWLSASVTEDASTIVADMFQEADRRDPEHQRVRIALVDGNNHQIDRIAKEARPAS
jgi:hypothetical protein